MNSFENVHSSSPISDTNSLQVLVLQVLHVIQGNSVLLERIEYFRGIQVMTLEPMGHYARFSRAKRNVHATAADRQNILCIVCGLISFGEVSASLEIEN